MIGEMYKTFFIHRLTLTTCNLKSIRVIFFFHLKYFIDSYENGFKLLESRWHVQLQFHVLKERGIKLMKLWSIQFCKTLMDFFYLNFATLSDLCFNNNIFKAHLLSNILLLKTPWIPKKWHLASSPTLPSPATYQCHMNSNGKILATMLQFCHRVFLL